MQSSFSFTYRVVFPEKNKTQRLPDNLAEPSVFIFQRSFIKLHEISMNAATKVTYQGHNYSVTMAAHYRQHAVRLLPQRVAADFHRLAIK